MHWFEKIRTVAKSSLTTSERIVLIMLARYANKMDVCWPSVRSIGYDTGMKSTAVKQAIRSLRSKGAIETRRRRRPDGTLSTFEFTLRWDCVPETLNVPCPEAVNGSSPAALNVPQNLSITEDTPDSQGVPVLPCKPKPLTREQVEPFAAAWLLRYEGDPDVTIRSAMRRKFAALVATHGMERALEYWQNFLTSTDVQFVGIGAIAKFVSTFGSWDRVSTRTARR